MSGFTGNGIFFSPFDSLSIYAFSFAAWAFSCRLYSYLSAPSFMLHSASIFLITDSARARAGDFLLDGRPTIAPHKRADSRQLGLVRSGCT